MPAGMVHALHDIHRVLKPDGILLDFRPAIGNRPVEVDLPDVTLHVGEIDSTATIPDKRASHYAMGEVVADGWFKQEHEETFELVTDIDTVHDLREYGKSFHQSILPEAVIQQVESLTIDEAPDTFTIRVRRPMYIARYRKNDI